MRLHDLTLRLVTWRRLGSAGRVVGHTPGGNPIFQVGEHRLAYRQHGRTRYWRPVVPCQRCGVGVRWEGARVVSAADLSELSERPDLQSVVCRSCRAAKPVSAGRDEKARVP